MNHEYHLKKGDKIKCFYLQEAMILQSALEDDGYICHINDLYVVVDGEAKTVIPKKDKRYKNGYRNK